jgi:Icc-related predicted phosphoesterase
MAYFKSIHIHFWVEYLSYLELIVFFHAKELKDIFDPLIGCSKEILFNLGNDDYRYVTTIVKKKFEAFKQKIVKKK